MKRQIQNHGISEIVNKTTTRRQGEGISGVNSVAFFAKRAKFCEKQVSKCDKSDEIMAFLTKI